MGSDISRATFDKAKHYQSVVLQQGRVLLDADWNEQQDITAHRAELLTLDAVGPCGAPNYAPGFQITVDPVTLVATIGKGRFYIDGFLCENEEDVPYADQPDLIDPPDFVALLANGPTHTAIVYLNVWQREITALDDPHIREQALDVPDTAARLKTVWQVKLLPVTVIEPDRNLVRASLGRLVMGLDEYAERLGATAATVAEEVKRWAETLRPITDADASTLRGQTAETLLQRLKQLRRDLNRLGRRTGTVRDVRPLLSEVGRLDRELAKLVQGPTCLGAFDEWFQLTKPTTSKAAPDIIEISTNLSHCSFGPGGDPGLLENQLYRIEVHRPGELTDPPQPNGPTFKWSRNNGSVITGVTRIDGSRITVTSLGLDDLTQLAHGQWVEVLDDRLELAGLSGQLVQVDTTDPATQTVTMQQPVTPLAASPSGVDLARHPKLRWWDQDGDDQGLAPSAGGSLPIENELAMTFSVAPYKTGDYWQVPVRSNGAIEWPPFDTAGDPRTPQFPVGIEHHYCRLAIVERDEDGNIHVQDCRRIFAPLAAPAMRVVATNWENDLPFSLTRFVTEGLAVWFDAEPFPQSLSAATVIVTIEVPVGNEVSGGVVSPRRSFALSLILDGEIGVVGNVLRWVPATDTLRDVFEQAARGRVSIQDLRLRVVLKGHTIYSDQDLPILHLDGQAFGRAKPPASGASEPTTALVFPTGSGDPASDFESWFTLLDDTYSYGYGYGSGSIGGHLL
jgi:hypothetical protein